MVVEGNAHVAPARGDIIAPARRGRLVPVTSDVDENYFFGDVKWPYRQWRLLDCPDRSNATRRPGVWWSTARPPAHGPRVAFDRSFCSWRGNKGLVFLRRGSRLFKRTEAADSVPGRGAPCVAANVLSCYRAICVQQEEEPKEEGGGPPVSQRAAAAEGIASFARFHRCTTPHLTSIASGGVAGDGTHPKRPAPPSRALSVPALRQRHHPPRRR